MNEIYRKEVLAPGIKRFEIVAPEIALRRKAGQFVIVRATEEGERIPLTIADANPARGLITLIVQEVGKTTRQLGTLQDGDFLLDVCGPLGEPTAIKNFGNCVCLAGGVGTAEIYPVVVALRRAGNQVTTIIGARSKNLLILEYEMRQASDELIVTTDDGSYGQKGLVVDPLRRMLQDGYVVQRVFCIGPMPMMRAVADATRPYAIPTIVSLNPVMVDGTGMCGGCRVTVGGKVKFACVDGPDFDAHEVDFDELVRRQQMYRSEEQEALQRYLAAMESEETKHRCRMTMSTAA